MRNSPDRSIGVRTFYALCGTVILCSLLSVFFVGFQPLAITLVVLASAGLAIPVLAGEEGVPEMILAVLAAMLDGMLASIEAILSIVSSGGDD